MMQIKKIAVSNFRKFVEPIEISGLQPGLNIVAGSNEDGKSTILQAIKAALYTKHSTTATAAFQPYNCAALPEVEIEFAIGAVDYRLRKTFGKKGTAELRSSSALFQGFEAEEKLQELLQLGKEKGRESTSIWNVLWVDQGTAFQAPEVGELGRRTINQALSSELGRLVAGDQGGQLMARVRDLYAKWFTPKSKDHSAKSEYRLAEKELLELLPQYEQAQEQLKIYEATLAQLDETRKQLARHEDNNSLQKAQEDLANARKSAEEFLKLKGELDRRRAEMQTLSAEYERVSAVWKTRREVQKQLESALAELVELEARLAAARTAFDTVACELHEQQQQEAESDQALEQCDALCRFLEAQTQVAALQKRCAELRDRRSKAEQSQKSAVQFRDMARSIAVDEKALERLKAMERRLLQMQAQLQAVATRVQLFPRAGSSAIKDGTTFDTAVELLITECATFELPGWGEIKVVPGGEGIEDLQEQTDALGKQFAGDLQSLGCQSIEDAEHQQRKRAQLLQAADEALRDVLKYAPAGLPAIVDEMAITEQELNACLTEGAEAADVDDAAEQLKTARSQRDKLKQQLQQLRAVTQLNAQKLSSTGSQVQLLIGQQNTLLKRKEELTAQLAALRSEEADDQLEQRMTEARVKYDAACKQYEELHQQLAGTDQAAAQRAIEEAQARLEALQRTIQHLREQKSALEGSLKTFGKAGIAEECARLSEKKDFLADKCKRLLAKAEAVRLLYETLSEAEARSKQELTAPLLAHLQPYIQTVFPSARLTVDSAGLVITQLSREGKEEPYAGLSLGTREQLSVLMRLAFANVLVDNEYPAVVILDDALVYSDEGRLKKVQNVLKQAAAKFQIIAFTCRRRDWQGVKGNLIDLKRPVE